MASVGQHGELYRLKHTLVIRAGAGELFGGVGSVWSVTTIQPRLLNTHEIMGNLGMAGAFPYAFSVLQTLTATVLPAIPESVTNGKKIPGQYYATMTYKYGGFASGFIAAGLGEITFADVPALVEVQHAYTPSSQNRGIYDQRFRVFLGIYKQMRGIYRKLNTHE
jgi:hypothetical protein